MQPDDLISLVVGGIKLTNFVRYSVTSDLFEAADAFEIEIADISLDVKSGVRCELYVNGQKELTGLIDKVSKHIEKTDASLTIEGRDLMGIVVDSYCTEYPDLASIKLEDLAARLLKNTPFIGRSSIRFGKGDKDRIAPLTRRDVEEDYKYTQIKPGTTIFDALKTTAMAWGMIFFNLPDGTFIFGQPITEGKPGFSLISRKDGRSNNIISATLTEDYSQRYSQVTVMGQSDGDYEGKGYNIKSTIKDASFPFYKPYVAILEHDGQKPDAYARIIMEDQKFKGYELEIKTPYHGQNGANYQVNAMYHVEHDDLKINGDFVCYHRTFSRSKLEGSTTMVRLAKPGVTPA
jgi:prophage tail gpP-like protein